MPVIIIVGTIVVALAIGSVAYLSNRNATQSISDASEIMGIEEMGDAATPESFIENEPEDATPAFSMGDEIINTPDNMGVSGTFNANSSYLTPRRTEHTVDLTLTLEKDIVTAVSVAFDRQPTGQYSNDNQARFDTAYKTEVVGKRLENISLSRVGGASLTSQAFNEAVAQIIDQTS